MNIAIVKTLGKRFFAGHIHELVFQNKYFRN